ncbi:hypothetical protein AZSI13_24430 [Azospira sp. I13]|nr:hypothetical protein AZSI13_24430 [Azospira sp. I13]
MPFEFLALLDEILGVISEFGYTKIIVVCDQLNHLPPKANYDLLRQNIDVLASKKITFVVSAENIKNEKGFEDRVDTEILLKSFSLWMNLVGFGSRNEVKDYVDNCFAAHQIDDIDFIDGNCDLIYSVCEGNPWFIAKMLRMVYQDVIAAGKNKIDIGDFEKYGIRFAKAVTAYKAAEGCLRWSELNDMLNMG